MRNKQDRIDIINEFFADKEFDKLREWIIKTNFLNTPASRKYHGAYEGGLADHSIKVAATLLDLTEKNNLVWLKKRSPVLIGFAHDFCKFDKYIYNGKEYVYNEELKDDRHAERSIDILKDLIPDLTEEEILCIKYHMGFTIPQEEWEGFREAIRKYPNVLWTHQADMIASFIYNT